MDSRPLTMFRRKTNVLFEKKSEAVISKLKAIAENNEEANSNEMLSAIEHLKTELKAAYSEVEKLTKVNNNRRKGDFHLSFLFSIPLIRKKNNNIEEVSQINYLRELDWIEQVFKSSSLQINYKIGVATNEHLRKEILEGPIVLHFSGHGIKNTKEFMGD